MTIKKDFKGLVSIPDLNLNEINPFIKFLKFERQRHVEDIININKSLTVLYHRKGVIEGLSGRGKRGNE